MSLSDLRTYQPPDNSLSGRTLLITGSGQGLGRTIALGAARLGASIILHGRNTQKLEHVYDEILGSCANEPIILPMDFATATDHDFDQMAGAIESQLGTLDAVVHCAAQLLSPAPIEQQHLEAWTQTLRVNLAAPMALTRACAKLLRASKDASVIFTGETHGLHPAAFWGGFAAAKSALVTLTQILAQEWAHLESPRVNMIVPGKIDSPQRKTSHPGEHPSERATLESVLPAYLYLLGADSRGVSGRIFEF
jgi:NAD(P)-dependent dehydrogenase (short-subunit alcohol dehydrogenase family)